MTYHKNMFSTRLRAWCIVQMFVVVAGCSVHPLSPPRSNQASALEIVRTVSRLENEHRSRYGTYSTLAELVRSSGGRIESAVISGTYRGFKFNLNLKNAGSGYELVAIPERVGETGYWSYFSDESGEIRVRYDGHWPTKNDKLSEVVPDGDREK